MQTTSTPLILTKGKGEDGEEEEDEEEQVTKPVKKKGKVIISKPSKPATTLFTRKSNRKGGTDVVFSKPPPTLEERLKKMEEGVGITNFKALKYEIRTDVQKKKIEDLVLIKMGKWKYSPDQIAPQVPKVLLDKLQLRWDSTIQIVKDIHEQTIKQLLPNLSNADVKADLKKHEGKMLLRFHTCLVLINDIDLVVRDVPNMWKNIYHLHEPSKDLVEIKDDNSSEEEDDTLDITITIDDYEELMKDDVKEREEEDEKEENDRVRIAAQVIASLPHSPMKVSTSSGIESSSAKVITSTTDTLFVGSLFATSQLLVTTMEVSTTSSTKLQTSPSTSAMSTSTTTCRVSFPSFSTVLTTSDLSTIPVSSSVVNTLVLHSIDTTISYFQVYLFKFVLSVLLFLLLFLFLNLRI